MNGRDGSGEKAANPPNEVAHGLKLAGRVVSGRKRGARNAMRDREKLKGVLGVTVVEGTLNVILKRPVLLTNETAIRISVDDGGPPRRLWPARLNGTPVWISRRVHPLHVVSVLAGVHLRSHFHLSDGDRVELEVRPFDVSRASLAGRLTWNFFWLGRKKWYYTRDRYLRRGEKWCARFGATQLGGGRDRSVAPAKSFLGRFRGNTLPAEPVHQGERPDEMIRSSGQVASGRGRASSYVERQADKIRNALGERVVEGSLNIVLKRPVMLRNDTAIKTAFDGELVRLHWAGRLNGTRVWLQRWPNAPLHIIELFCAVHLRTRLNLADGDCVEVQARRRDVQPISKLGRVSWMLLWFGRRKWHYTNERYYAPAERWGTTFGATQLGTEKRFRDLAAALVKRVFGTRL
jgi:CTP-dependent riboflavin kinase